MPFWRAERIAQIGIGVLLLVLVRSLGEYFRLKHFYGQSLALARFEPYIGGCLITALCTGVGFALYVARRYKSTIILCACAVAGLVIYKIVVVA